MLEELKKRLGAAQGRSEFVITVVCDIRGFSAFSARHESPDTAMFIKRFYLKLLNDYFTMTCFAKPTGDGLLMVFGYSENTLQQVAEDVLNTCMKAVADFPSMFAGDPMINFATPGELGFGVARGTACCLFSGKRILDYSGQLLNLTARLNDLARPRGVVVDGAFQKGVIPQALRASFVQDRAYIRSIAEENAREILRSKEVRLPSYSQAPLACTRWVIERREMTVDKLNALADRYEMNLKREVLTKEKVKLEFFWPNQKLKECLTWLEIRNYELYTDAKGCHLAFDTEEVKAIAAEKKLAPETKVIFECQYVPKPRRMAKS